MTARRGKRKKDKEPPIPKGQPKVKITDARGDPVHLEMGDLKEVKMLFGSDIKISGEAQEYLGGLANQHFNLEGSWVFSRHSPFPFSHYRGNIIQVTHFLGRELGVPYRDILGGVPIICSSEFMVGARQF
jgi:hypothetical protein